MSEVHERPAETGALVTVRSALPTILAADTNDILGKLKSELDGFIGDATTERGRKEIASKAHKVSIAKQDLLRLAGTLKEGHRKVLNGIIAEEKLIVGQMDPLRDAVRKLLDDYEAIEAARVDAHRAALVEVEGWSSIPDDWTATQIADRIEELKAHPHLSREWQEFKDRAGTAAKNSYNALVAARVAAQEREVEAARLAEEERARAEAEALRLAQEEQARIERARAEAAAEATRVAEAAAVEQARKVEEAAQREREAAEAERLRVVREAAEAAAAAEAKAKREAEEAAAAAQALLDAAAAREKAQAVAIERAEAERVETARVAEARRMAGHKKAIADFTWVVGAIAGQPSVAEVDAAISTLAGMHADREWEEFASEAAAERQKTHDLMLTVRQSAVAREVAAKAAYDAEIERQKEAAANAARETERKRQEAEAVEVEVARVKREKNVAHRAAINREVLAALVGCGMTEEIGRIVISSIVRGEVPHVTIAY